MINNIVYSVGLTVCNLNETPWNMISKILYLSINLWRNHELPVTTDKYAFFLDTLYMISAFLVLNG